MSAPVPDNHTNAVARAINAPAFVNDDRFPGAMKAMQQDAARRDADAILSSTDPDVFAALAHALTRTPEGQQHALNALLEAGALERTISPGHVIRHPTMGTWLVDSTDPSAPTCERLVTEWREAGT